jgi:pyridoxamine 5'-phosphate oxidase
VNISNLRREYNFSGLNEGDLDPNPFTQFDKWFEQALIANLTLPDAMTLATAAKDGTPSARIVVLRGFDERGFIFYTNYESQKGRELAENPRAALVFHWAELERQVRITGLVSRISHEESENYFRSRPLESRLSALASRQSQIISSRQVLENRVEQFMKAYPDGNIPLPLDWGGFRLLPNTLEFWQGRISRLHDRFRYTRQSDNSWLIERLSP